MNALQIARAAWRRSVPEGLRRKAAPVLNHVLQAYVRRAARAPHGAGLADGPIKIVGYFSGSHGIAASARLAARAFEAMGMPVERVDASHAELTWLPRGAAPERASAWIFHLNPPELLAEMAALGPRRLVGPRYGYWAWELPKAPVGWSKDARIVDEVWAPSTYTAQAYGAIRAPVRVVPHPLFEADYRDVAPPPRRAAFQVVSLFDFNSSVARKNPDGAIEAFRRAFADDPSAELTIKTQNGGLFPDLLARLQALCPPNVRLVDETWSYGDVQALIAGADVLMSLHRAEGFGLTLAEAMALGCPVVATGFSGNLDFMDETNSLLVPYAMVPVQDPQAIYRKQSWANPDIAVAAAGLTRLRDDPVLRRRLAEAGRSTVRERLSPEAWFKTLPDSLQAAALRLKADA